MRKYFVKGRNCSNASWLRAAWTWRRLLAKFLANISIASMLHNSKLQVCTSKGGFKSLHRRRVTIQSSCVNLKQLFTQIHCDKECILQWANKTSTQCWCTKYQSIPQYLFHKQLKTFTLCGTTTQLPLNILTSCLLDTGCCESCLWN
jgi:hypothetical protein